MLSTCLRTEVYAVVDRFHDAVAEIYDVLSEHSHLSVEELSAHATVRFDDDVTSHLFSVTSGLESVVTGETEVVGQVRRAFERAQEEGTCGPVLSALFRHALQTGKRVRTETGITQGHHVVRLRRGDRGPRRGPGGAARRAGGRGRRRRHGPRRVPRPVGHRAGRRAAAGRRGEPLRGTGAGPGAPGRDRAVRHAGGAARARGRRAGRRRRRAHRRRRRVPRARAPRTSPGSPARCS